MVSPPAVHPLAQKMVWRSGRWTNAVSPPLDPNSSRIQKTKFFKKFKHFIESAGKTRNSPVWQVTASNRQRFAEWVAEGYLPSCGHSSIRVSTGMSGKRRTIRKWVADSIAAAGESTWRPKCPKMMTDTGHTFHRPIYTVQQAGRVFFRGRNRNKIILYGTHATCRLMASYWTSKMQLEAKVVCHLIWSRAHHGQLFCVFRLIQFGGDSARWRTASHQLNLAPQSCAWMTRTISRTLSLWSSGSPKVGDIFTRQVQPNVLTRWPCFH